MMRLILRRLPVRKSPRIFVARVGVRMRWSWEVRVWARAWVVAEWWFQRASDEEGERVVEGEGGSRFVREREVGRSWRV